MDISFILGAMPTQHFRSIFVISFILTIICLITLIIIHLSSSSITFENILLHILIFLLIPQSIGLSKIILKAPKSPTILTITIWFLYLFIFIQHKIRNFITENNLIKKDNYWRCKNCKTLNNDLYMMCQKCKSER